MDMVVGTKYWVMASWTSAGLKAHQCTWDGGFVDKERKRKGQIFLTEKEAYASITTQD